MYIHNIISVKGVQAVLLEQDRIQLKKWETATLFGPQKLLKSLKFEPDQEFTIKAVDLDGHKQLVIESLVSQNDQLSLVESLSGVLSDSETVDVKDYRSERKEERLKKYESLT